MNEKNYDKNKKSRNSQIRYDYINNAALAPEYLPNEPARKTQEQKKTPVRVIPGYQARPKNKGKRALGILFVLGLAMLSCFVLYRNALIYENNVNIQNLGKEISAKTVELNTIKYQYAAAIDIEEYLDIAGDTLNMNYPAEGQMVEITKDMENSLESSSNSQKNNNIFDKILDWLNSLERSR